MENIPTLETWYDRLDKLKKKDRLGENERWTGSPTYHIPFESACNFFESELTRARAEERHLRDEEWKCFFETVIVQYLTPESAQSFRDAMTRVEYFKK